MKRWWTGPPEPDCLVGGVSLKGHPEKQKWPDPLGHRPQRLHLLETNLALNGKVLLATW